MDEDDDDFISFGTPLPEIEDEPVLRKKVAREQEVRDERGRQRFHGAFTGGFSAGYFNTVGTKEGWAPSTFVSSRNKTADRFSQNPEDFMDAEDFGEFGIATRHIQTTNKFTAPENTKTYKRKLPELDSAIPGEAPLKELVKPVNESIGIEILKKLGWKQGQGIGPRVKKTSAKTYGCSPFPSTAAPEEEDPMANMFTFAPTDVSSETFKPKDDVFGLGYTGLSKASVLTAHIDLFNPTSTKSFLKKDKKKLTISGQAFGVGAFEEDDDDIYSKDDMSNYDFSEFDRKSEPASKKDISKNKNSLNSLTEVLEGFSLATKKPAVKKYYAPPDLPPDYNPNRFHQTSTSTVSESRFKPRHNLTSDGRSLLLGEKKFQAASPVIDIKKGPSDHQPGSATKAQPAARSHTFRPFPNDEMKQMRYENYLKLKATGALDQLVQPTSMTEWEKQQELEEFSRAAMLFRPLSAALSSKFESRSNLDVEHEVMDAIAKAKEKGNQKSKEKRKLVGQSKHKTSEWRPASLLCKRFNVPNPYPDSTPSGEEKKKQLFENMSFERLEPKYQTAETASSDPSTSSGVLSVEPSSSAKSNSESGPVPSAVPLQSTTVSVIEAPKERPPLDFFKDIFENSSSDEDEPTKPQPPKTESTKLSESNQIFEISSTTPEVPPNKKQGFGVFANLDLDALNTRTPKTPNTLDTGTPKTADLQNTGTPKTADPQNTGTPKAVAVDEVVDERSIDVEIVGVVENVPDEPEGPALPPGYNEQSAFISSIPTRSDYKKHSKHKSKHKHKHHKHKSKKKKKKKSSHKDSSDSATDSDEDLPESEIVDRIKKLQKVLKSPR